MRFHGFMTLIESVAVLSLLVWWATWLGRDRLRVRAERGAAWFAFRRMLLALAGEHSSLSLLEEGRRFGLWLSSPGGLDVLLRAGVADSLVVGGLTLIDLSDDRIPQTSRMTQLATWEREHGPALARLRAEAGLRGNPPRLGLT